MPKFFTTHEILRVMARLGFFRVSQKGSHIKLKKETSHGTLTVIVPQKNKPIPQGTFRSILKQAEIDQEIFEKYL